MRSKSDSKLENHVAEGTFIMYGKSAKQYHVLPKGYTSTKLVTNPEFREREAGYLSEAMLLTEPNIMAVDKPARIAPAIPGVPIAVSSPIRRVYLWTPNRESQKQKA